MAFIMDGKEHDYDLPSKQSWPIMTRNKEDMDVNPEDSASNCSRRSRRSHTSSIRSQRAQAITREIELTAKAEVLKKRHESEMRRLDLLRQVEEENFKQREIQVHADLEAAKAISNIFSDDDESSDVSSRKSNASETMIQAIIDRANQLQSHDDNQQLSSPSKQSTNMTKVTSMSQQPTGSRLTLQQSTGSPQQRSTHQSTEPSPQQTTESLQQQLTGASSTSQQSPGWSTHRSTESSPQQSTESSPYQSTESSPQQHATESLQKKLTELMPQQQTFGLPQQQSTGLSHQQQTFGSSQRHSTELSHQQQTFGSSQRHSTELSHQQQTFGLPQQQSTGLSHQQQTFGSSQRHSTELSHQQQTFGLPQQQSTGLSHQQQTFGSSQRHSTELSHQQQTFGSSQRHSTELSHQQQTFGLPQQQSTGVSHQQQTFGSSQRQSTELSHQQQTFGSSQRHSTELSHQQQTFGLPQQQSTGLSHQQQTFGLPQQQSTGLSHQQQTFGSPQQQFIGVSHQQQTFGSSQRQSAESSQQQQATGLSQRQLTELLHQQQQFGLLQQQSTGLSHQQRAFELSPQRSTGSWPQQSVGSTSSQQQSYGLPFLSQQQQQLNTHEWDDSKQPWQLYSYGQRNTCTDPMIAILQQLASLQQQSTLPKPQLECFDGSDILAYPTFMKNFKTIVDRTYDPARKLEILLKFTKGEAKTLIKDCVLIGNPEEAFNRAIKLLQATYGHPAILATSFQTKAEAWPKIKSGDREAMRRFAVFIVSLCTAKYGNVELAGVDRFEFLKNLASKLPTALQQLWIREVGKCRDERNRPPNIEDFEKFISQIARDENDPRITGLGYQGRNNTISKEPARKKTHAAAVKSKSAWNNKKAKKDACAFCKDEKHNLESCGKLRERHVSERLKFLRELGVCFGCLRKGTHMSKQCNKKLTCKTCNKSHPTVLHQQTQPKQPARPKHSEQQPEKEADNMIEAKSTTCGLTGTGVKGAYPVIIPVLVHSKKTGRAVETYAFLDEGSDAVFCSEALQRQLGVKGKNTKMEISTITEDKIVDSQILRGLEVSDLDGRNFVSLPTVYTQERIPANMNDVVTAEEISCYSHLQDVRLKCLHGDQVHIGLLIGNNIPEAFEPWKVINSDNGGPYAIRTLFGWTVHGLPRPFSKPVNSINRIKVQETVAQQLEKLYNMDFSERIIEDQPERSIQDKKFISEVETSLRFVDGHYEIALPLINEEKFPNNYAQAEVRLRHLKRKLQSNKELHKEYSSIMKDMIENNFAEEVLEEDLSRSDAMVWYVPHHSVVHPQKGKVRVVFDCAATHKGKSLNSSLLQGPDFTSNLIGVLLRFRQHPVAVMGDVKAMFHQVRVPESDRDLLRFLWWTDGDPNLPIKQYRMCVHLFGATSSPSCANYALRKAAEYGKEKYGAEACNTVLHNFYVDDCLKSVENEREAIKLVNDVIHLCKDGGFKLTKWSSNSREVLQSIAKDDRAETVKTLDLDNEDLPTERALGLLWSPQEDKFRFQINLKEKPCTRRGILSTVSAIYDPLGLVAPVILPAKQILQSLCKQQLGWDDEIPEMHRKKWQLWKEELPKLQEFSVNRCLTPEGFGKPKDIQLHHFSDASQIGYGTASYLRFENDSGHVHCSLVMAKSRVAPLKQTTIPRLELSAATVAVRVNHMIQQELEIPVHSTHFWTDSMSVLRYIINESTRFHTFVANRVAIIRDGSRLSQWRYVDTDNNPADDSSRGLSVEKFLDSKRWIQGPEFLFSPEEQWPKANMGDMKELEDDPEVKKKASVNAVTLCVKELEHPMERLMQHYSSWYHLKKAVAWLLKVKGSLLHAVSVRPELSKARNRTLHEEEYDEKDARRQDEEDDTHVKCDDKHEEKKDHESGIGDNTSNRVIESVPTNVQDYSTSTCKSPWRLRVKDLQQAEAEIIKYTQGKAFPEEITALKGSHLKSECGQVHRIKKTSMIYRLNPQLKNGILHVGGRLSNAMLPDDQKFPVIIPKQSSIARLILQEIHVRTGHGGRNQMLARLHEKYWIPGANVAARKLTNSCVTCRKRNASVQQQMMGDLPQDRVTSEELPFTRVGIDFFGPLEIKQGRSIVKRYGVVFICLASKAIHLEKAESLSSDACLNVLRRFLSRRGQVKQIRSDNGTNFVSADKELRKEIALWNQERIHDYLLQKDVEWVFNPPAGSHHGGIWERQIRSIKKVMRSVIKEQTLTDDALHTLLCELEAIINSRPITSVPADASDPEPLTPNHLLQLKTACNLPPTVTGKLSQYAKRRWKQVQYLADLFWRRWIAEYLPQLQERQKWINPKRNVMVGDIVLVANEATPRNVWPLARVVETYPGSDGLVRRVKVKTKASTYLIRPIDKLVLLLEGDVPEQAHVTNNSNRASWDSASTARPKRSIKPVKRLDL